MRLGSASQVWMLTKQARPCQFFVRMKADSETKRRAELVFRERLLYDLGSIALPVGKLEQSPRTTAGERTLFVRGPRFGPACIRQGLRSLVAPWPAMPRRRSVIQASVDIERGL
jgi:hypothetical protein